MLQNPAMMSPEAAKGLSTIKQAGRIQEGAQGRAQQQYLDLLSNPKQDPAMAAAYVSRDSSNIKGPLQGVGGMPHDFTSVEALPYFAEEAFPLIGFAKTKWDRSQGKPDTQMNADGTIGMADWDSNGYAKSTKNLIHTPTIPAQIQAAKSRIGQTFGRAPAAAVANKPGMTTRALNKVAPKTVAKIAPKLSKVFAPASLVLSAKGIVAPSQETKSFAEGMASGDVPLGMGATFTALDPEQQTANVNVAHNIAKQTNELHKKNANKSYGLLQQQRAQGMLNEKQYMQGVRDLDKSQKPTNQLMSMWKSIRGK
jgi:hypothetical protein